MIRTEFVYKPAGVERAYYALNQVPGIGEQVTFDEGYSHELAVTNVLWHIDPVRGGQEAVVFLERNTVDISEDNNG